MLISRIKAVSSVLAAVIMSGCSYFTPPMERPIIEDHSHDGRVTTFATIPSRRMVIMSSNDDKGGKIFVCAEPSADVSDNLASSLSAAVSGKGPSSGDKAAAELAASIAKTLETTAQHLFKRTQGLQLYRDGMYGLCQARMNGVITNAQFIEKADELRKNAFALIQAEIPHLANTQPTNTANAGGAVTANATASVGSASPAATTSTSQGESDQ